MEENPFLFVERSAILLTMDTVKIIADPIQGSVDLTKMLSNTICQQNSTTQEICKVTGELTDKVALKAVKTGKGLLKEIKPFTTPCKEFITKIGKELLFKIEPMTTPCKEVVQMAGKMILNELEPVGRSYKRFIQTTGLIDEAYRLYRVYERFNEEHYSIPPEKTREYVKDSLFIPLFFMPIKNFFGLSKKMNISETSVKTASDELKVSVKSPTRSIENTTQQIRSIYTDYSNLYSLMDKINPLIPNYGHLGVLEGEKLWTYAIRDYGHEFSAKNIKYFKDEPGEIIVAKLIGNKKSFIVKESEYPCKIIPELVNTKFLNENNFQYLRSAKPIAIGKGPQGYFVIKSFLEETPFIDLLSKAGSIVNREERSIFLNDLVQGSYSAGNFLGDFQSKGLFFRSGMTRQDKKFFVRGVEGYIADFSANLDYVEELAFKPNFQRPFTGNIGRLQSIENGLRQSPGRWSYGLGDANGSQWGWSPKYPHSIGYFDACLISTSPKRLVESEYYEFLHQIETEGFEFGLTLEETFRLKRAFSMGHQETYIGQRPFEAQRFFDITSTMDTIAFLEGELSKGNDNETIRMLIKYFADSLNNKLK
jgi:hypothetical protein